MTGAQAEEGARGDQPRAEAPGEEGSGAVQGDGEESGDEEPGVRGGGRGEAVGAQACARDSGVEPISRLKTQDTKPRGRL